jgi:hypothetical protein
MAKENVGTFLLNDEIITVIEAWGVRNISLLLLSGTVTVTGSMKLGERDDDIITLQSAVPLNISFDFPIDGYNIDASSGSALMVTGR